MITGVYLKDQQTCNQQPAYQGNGASKKDDETAAGDVQGLAQGDLEDGAENIGQCQRGWFKTKLLNELPHNAEEDHQVDVNGGVAHTVYSNEAQDQDEREEKIVGDSQDFYPDANQWKVQG